MILVPLLGSDPNNNALLERMVFETTSQEMDEFYEVLVDPSKTQQYITKNTKTMEDNNKQLTHLSHLFQMKFIKANEHLASRHEEEESEQLLDRIE